MKTAVYALIGLFASTAPTLAQQAPDPIVEVSADWQAQAREQQHLQHSLSVLVESYQKLETENQKLRDELKAAKVDTKP